MKSFPKFVSKFKKSSYLILGYYTCTQQENNRVVIPLALPKAPPISNWPLPCIFSWSISFLSPEIALHSFCMLKKCQVTFQKFRFSWLLFFSESFVPMSSNMFVGCGRFTNAKNSISASERSQKEKSINVWAIHTPSSYVFSIMDSCTYTYMYIHRYIHIYKHRYIHIHMYIHNYYIYILHIHTYVLIYIHT